MKAAFDFCKLYGTNTRIAATVITVAGLLLAGEQVVCAQSNYQILHMFRDGSVPNDGMLPEGLTRGSDGNFYGTTGAGGSTVGETIDQVSFANGAGTVFRMTPSGQVTILHSFLDGSTKDDGSGPEAALLEGPDLNFYGTCYGGGATLGTETPGNGSLSGAGTVFKMTPSGVATTLHSFADGSIPNDGENPEAALTLGPNDDFYGVTFGGGPEINDTPNNGTFFRITSTGETTIIYDFLGWQFSNLPEEVQSPNSALVQGPTPGVFYGLNCAWGYDDLYLVTDWGYEMILAQYLGDGGTIGGDNAGLMMGSDGNLYGVTPGGFGGPSNYIGFGNVFQMTPLGAVTQTYEFNPDLQANDGSSPCGTLVQATDGNFYGVTSSGGDDSGHGTLFRVTPSGSENILHSFNDGSVANDGDIPIGLVDGKDGYLYGLTFRGGSAGDGIIWRFKIGTPPLPPTNFTATQSGGIVGLSWTASLGATSYSLYWGPPENSTTRLVASDVTSTSYIDTVEYTYKPSYYYAIYAVGPAGTSQGTIASTDPGPPPDQPNGLTAKPGNQQISLTWSAGTNATAYEVRRGVRSLGESTRPIAVVTSAGYIDTGVANDHHYFYIIRAVGFGGTSKISNEASAAAKLALPAPPSPVLAIPSSGKVMLSWKASVSATNYAVYRGPASHYEHDSPIAMITGTAYTDTGRINGKTYYYVIKAINAIGAGKSSAEVSATPKAP